MDASNLPKGQSQESTDGRPVNLPGIYVHKESKKQVITAEGDGGIVQADALMSPVYHGQWERVGDVPTRSELLAMQKAQATKDAKNEANAKVKAELEAFAK